MRGRNSYFVANKGHVKSKSSNANKGMPSQSEEESLNTSSSNKTKRNFVTTSVLGSKGNTAKVVSRRKDESPAINKGIKATSANFS